MFLLELYYAGRSQSMVIYWIKTETFHIAPKGPHMMRADHCRTPTWCGPNNDKKSIKLYKSSYSQSTCFLQYISLPEGHQSCPEKFKILKQITRSRLIAQIHLADMPYNISNTSSYTWSRNSWFHSTDTLRVEENPTVLSAGTFHSPFPKLLTERISISEGKGKAKHNTLL